MGHRRRIKIALPGWSVEDFCSSAAIVGPHCNHRPTHRTRQAASGMARAWQKRQDRAEVRGES